MGWFSNFAQLRRLAKDNRYLRQRVESLEKELKQTNEIRFEREMLLIDRFLTNQVKTFAIKDEAEFKAAIPSKPANTARNAFLQERKNEILEDFKEANLTEAEAEAYYRQHEPQFIDDFLNLGN